MLNPVESNSAMDSLGSPSVSNIQSYLNQVAAPWNGRHVWDNQTVDFFLSLLKPKYRYRLRLEWRWWKTIGFSSSVKKPDMLHEAVEWFRARHVQLHWMKSLDLAVSVLKEELRQKQVKQEHYSTGAEMRAAISKPDAHAGYTGLLYARRHKGDFSEDELEYLVRKLDELSRLEGNYNLPAVPGYRLQAKGPYDEEGRRDVTKISHKTRLVWIIDILVTILESQWQKPVQEVFNRLPWYAGGKNDAQINRILKESKKYYSKSFTIDMSKFDSTIPAFMIFKAFDVLKVMFESDSSFDEVGWNVMVNSFVNKSIYDPITKELVRVHDGVPSGSMWTNIIDSVVNRLMMEAFYCDEGVSDYMLNVCGDDNVNFTNTEDEEDMLHRLAAYYQRNFGVIVNPEKCVINFDLSTIEYLSRSWKDSGVWRLPIKMLQGLGCPERFRDFASGRANSKEIIMGYIESFPLGFDECCDRSRLHDFRRSMVGHKYITDLRYFTGLARLQRMYKPISDVSFTKTLTSIRRMRHASFARSAA